MSVIAKPQLRGMLKARTTQHFIMAVVFSTVCTLGYKFGIGERRKKKYAEFYKTYDIQKDYERMKRGGVFQSVTSDGVVKEW